MRKLIGLVEQRDKFLGDRGRLVNRLGHALKQYYPQVLEWFNEHHTVVFCDFLSRWPTLTQVKRAREASLERFFKKPSRKLCRAHREAHHGDQGGHAAGRPTRR